MYIDSSSRRKWDLWCVCMWHVDTHYMTKVPIRPTREASHTANHMCALAPDPSASHRGVRQQDNKTTRGNNKREEVGVRRYHDTCVRPPFRITAVGPTASSITTRVLGSAVLVACSLRFWTCSKLRDVDLVVRAAQQRARSHTHTHVPCPSHLPAGNSSSHTCRVSFRFGRGRASAVMGLLCEIVKETAVAEAGSERVRVTDHGRSNDTV